MRPVLHRRRCELPRLALDRVELGELEDLHRLPAQRPVGLQLDERVDEGILATLMQPPDDVCSDIR
ncbi:MAG TPA: hypothetical protein VFT27_06850 [Actinomycetota bacterium]|nr:hypothetical protein [Actinomycetota bacterium]